MKGFEDDRKRAQLSCCRLQSYAHLSSERVPDFAPSKVSFLWVSCKMASTTA